MNKKEIKTVPNNELIVEYVLAYSHFDTNFVLRRGTEKLRKHLNDLENELLARNILTVNDIKRLNM